jgi:hypothetical protein
MFTISAIGSELWALINEMELSELKRKIHKLRPVRQMRGEEMAEQRQLKYKCRSDMDIFDDCLKDNDHLEPLQMVYAYNEIRNRVQVPTKARVPRIKTERLKWRSESEGRCVI